MSFGSPVQAPLEARVGLAQSTIHPPLATFDFRDPWLQERDSACTPIAVKVVRKSNAAIMLRAVPKTAHAKMAAIQVQQRGLHCSRRSLAAVQDYYTVLGVRRGATAVCRLPLWARDCLIVMPIRKKSRLPTTCSPRSITLTYEAMIQPLPPALRSSTRRTTCSPRWAATAPNRFLGRGLTWRLVS